MENPTFVLIVVPSEAATPRRNQAHPNQQTLLKCWHA